MQVPIAVTLKLDERKLAAEEFARVAKKAGLIRERRIRREEALENFGKPGRDPHELGDVFATIIRKSGWGPRLQMASLESDWAAIVGDVNARHSRVASYVDGVLTIAADSPSWTQQLTAIAPTLKERIAERLSGLRIDDVRVTGPQAHGRGVRMMKYVQQNTRKPMRGGAR
ncbi:DUF721 domain-containing protein [uncultured Bifidobacterium sp.]|uniref:DUF721 domain-containing protein n=1 Tax=uncultured Bifidobacterium sp. TaxID=165187 RepID=UPI00258E5D50|nr:DUF721 domain-containing protein [uncultured Bifidobacterium sp.]